MKFIKVYTLFVCIFLLFFVGLIVSIDPYEKLGINVFGFKTKAVAQGRENKFTQFEYSDKKYDAFIFGSSAAHRYPTKTLNQLTGYTSYNYAVQHTTTVDYLAILRHIVSKGSAKLIFLQVDFTNLDGNFPTDNRLFNSSLNKFLTTTKKQDVIFDNVYFTLDAVRDSLRVIYVNLFGEARHIYAENGDYIYERPTPGPVNVQQNDYSDYVMSKERIELLKEFKALADQNQIKVVAITAPLSIEHIHAITQNEKFNKRHMEFKKELVRIFDSVYDFENESMAPYSTYQYFHNSTHPTREFSDMILRRVFSNAHPDIGTILNQDSH